MRNQYKKLFNDSLIFAIGSFGSKLITFFLVGFYTYYLTKSEYGTADLLLNTINLALPIVSLSVSEGVLRFVLDSKSQQEKVDWLRTALGTNVMGLGGLALLLGGLRLFGLWVDLSSGVGLLSFCLLTIQSFQLILMQYIKAVGKLKTYAANGILLSLLTLLFNLLLFQRLKNMIVAYFLSLVVANLFSLGFLAVNISWRALITRRKTVNSEQRKQLIAYSLPLIPNSAMWWILTTSSRFIMTFFLGVASNGMYAAASKIPNLLSVIGTIFLQAWQLSAVEQYHKKEAAAFYQKVFNHYSTLLLFSGLILLFLDPLASVLLSKEFYFAKSYIPLLLVSNFFSCISGFFGTTYIVVKKTRGILTTSLLGAAVNVLASLLLIPLIGINGASLASGGGFFLIFYLRKRQTDRFMKQRLSTKAMWLQVALLIGQIVLNQSGVLSGGGLFFSQGLLLVLIIFIDLFHGGISKKGVHK